MKKTPSDDRDYKSLYFETVSQILKGLSMGVEFDPNHLDGDQGQAIEYYLKDCARRTITPCADRGSVMAIFLGRIRRLVSNEPEEKAEEWSKLMEAVERHDECLETETKESFRTLRNKFLRARKPSRARAS